MNSITCLKDIVGFKTPCEVMPSRSGFWLNQIHGVNFQFAESIADAEYQSGKAFIGDLLEEAKLLVVDEMEMILRPYFKQATLLYAGCLCDFTSGYEAPGSGDRGVLITKIDGSNYTRIYIPRVIVCVADTTTIEIKITDGGNTRTYEGVLVEGGVQTEILLDYHAQFSEVEIYFDQTDVRVRNTSCAVGCYSCSGGASRTLNNENGYVRITGFDSLSSGGLDFFGLTPCVTVECVPSNLVCDFAKYLGLAVAYKWGGLFYNEVAMTKRINKFTTHTKDEARQMALYYDNFDENALGMYQKQMRSVVRGVFPYLNSINDACIECNSDRYEYVTG